MGESIVHELRELFSNMSADEEGVITEEEFLAFSKHNQVKEYLDTLHIDISDARRLFNLLDPDASGSIPTEEFIEGCMRLKGPAKSIDIHSVLFEVRRSLKKFVMFAEFTEEQFSDLQEVSKYVKALLDI